ncbi:MAG: bifunctional nuclease domain-containing protein [Microbacter sp.]
MSSRVKISVQGLISSKTTVRTFALLLGEENGNRRVTIIIGPMEAEAIAIQLQGIKPPRPLTHDLMINVLESFNLQLSEVYIHHFENGIFYSELLLSSSEKSEVIDARTSDAIALAVRVGCPIYMEKSIFDEYAIEFVTEEDVEITPHHEEEEEEEHIEPTLEELQEQLKQAVANEQYEEAARLRDLINNRSKSQTP